MMKCSSGSRNQPGPELVRVSVGSVEVHAVRGVDIIYFQDELARVESADDGAGHMPPSTRATILDLKPARKQTAGVAQALDIDHRVWFGNEKGTALSRGAFI